MKRIVFLIILLMTIGINTFSLNWGNGYWLLQPSLLPLLPNESYGYFYDSRFPTVKYEIYSDLDFVLGDWVYVQWMQDHGWWLDGRTWRGDSRSIDHIRGAIYIDPYEKVAIYFFADRETRSVFRVRVLKN